MLIPKIFYCAKYGIIFLYNKTNLPKKMTNQNIKEELTKKIGQKIRLLRIKSGYSSYENFAWDNNLPVRTYFRMESGTNFTIFNLIKILEIHSITLKDFFIVWIGQDHL
jgi:hypothetical protein